MDAVAAMSNIFVNCFTVTIDTHCVVRWSCDVVI
jgi:hypothetical protein